jgi:D-serine dehydratase
MKSGPMNLDGLLSTRIDATMKGVPNATGRDIVLADIGRMGWNLLRGDLPIPVATIDGAAMAANSRWMREFILAHGIRISPHGKATMAPQLFRRQLEDGAWGITVATVQQLQVCRRFGIKRVFMANQVVSDHDLRSVLRALRDDPALDFYCLVDSADNIGRLHDMARQFKAGRPLQVLIEGGVRGGRTGVRSFGLAMAMAGQVSACSPYLELRGVEGFEGVIDSKDQTDAPAVRSFIAELCALINGCLERRLFGERKPILSIGGSMYFDLVATHPDVGALKDRCEVILRSGCYLTHDSRMLTENFRRIRARTAAVDIPEPAFRPALTVWGLVQSLPEPGLAILNVGKRDVSYDVDLPIAERWFRSGLHAAPVPVPEPTVPIQINDQHLMFRVPADSQYRVGDVMGLGISHPCTTFDKWRVVYVVNERFDVTEGILTFF